MKTIIEPFRIKVVEPIRVSTPTERATWLRDAGYNLFGISAERVLIDLLTDSGTGAMSSEQWAGVMRGDESYAGARSFLRFEESVQQVTGFKTVLPTHQGRASERILCALLLGGPGEGVGKIVPNNAHFDTTRANIEASGAKAVDLLTPAGSSASQVAPFKGNMDVDKLRALLEERAADVPFVMVTVTCNSNGGQPVSMANLRAVRAVCDAYDVPLFLDACRFAENAWLIRQREPGQGGRPIPAIVREMFDLAHGATISAKKDGLVNMGGVLLLRDEELFARASNLLILTEGYVTYGGLEVATSRPWPLDSARSSKKTTCATACAPRPTSARSSSKAAWRSCVRPAATRSTSTPARSARTFLPSYSQGSLSPAPCMRRAESAPARLVR
jgi:tyrosine phenol-lyase